MSAEPCADDQVSATSTTRLGLDPSFVVQNEQNLDRVFRPEQSDLDLGDHYLETGATTWSTSARCTIAGSPEYYAAQAAAMAMGQVT